MKDYLKEFDEECGWIFTGSLDEELVTQGDYDERKEIVKSFLTKIAENEYNRGFAEGHLHGLKNTSETIESLINNYER